jgi:acyl-CoA thioester hydrolase
MRWADMDLLGHVNNTVYVDYLQEARVDLLRRSGHGAQGQTGLTEGVVVVRHEVEYVAPLTYAFRPVRIECWVTEIRAASFTMAYEITQEHDGERRVHLRARTVLSPYVFGAERPRRLTAEEKEALTAWLEPGERTVRERPPAPVREKVGHYPVHVRFSDVDVYGHVNNVKYFEYFMEARILLSARLWRDVRDDVQHPLMVVARTDVDYRVPILLRPEPYDAWSWISRVGTTSWTIESEICDGEEVLARARVVMVFVDPESHRPAPPPAEFREALRAVSRTC